MEALEEQAAMVLLGQQSLDLQAMWLLRGVVVAMVGLAGLAAMVETEEVYPVQLLP
jgi:hypothetical protein